MKGICEANCEECELLKIKKCQGCKNTKGCPFGKKCWIAKYIEIGGKENFEKLKEDLINEINFLNIDGMKKVEELYPLNGTFINLEYVLPNKTKVRFLKDNEAYLGSQIDCKFNDNEIKKYFGIAANMNFLLICEYEENGKNPEILFYKKR
ncbi:MAG: DUF3795 domain-containing protein [Bacilli bacterium]|nr:DUF3795 domain-containing protein [Bacilli bacterium]